jgi:hypothetical protein
MPWIRLWDLLLSGLAVCGGVGGIIWPELYRGSMEEQYTSRNARVAGFVILAIGIAGLVAILCYKGETIDFFPT